MQMNKDQVIRIKGKEGGWYKEAIFVINKDIIVSCSQQDIGQRADLIIGNYAKRNGLRPQVKYASKDQSKDGALNLILFSSIAILVICLWLL